MTDIQLYSKISSLPDNLKKQVNDFIDSISSKKPEEKGETKDKGYGYAKGAITIKPDFDEPLEDFKDYM